jgi:hypothetical protein
LHACLRELAGQLKAPRTQVPMDKYSVPASINTHTEQFLLTKDEVTQQKAKAKRAAAPSADEEELLAADESREGPGEGEEDTDEDAEGADAE